MAMRTLFAYDWVMDTLELAAMVEKARSEYPELYISAWPPITSTMELFANLGLSVTVRIEAERKEKRFTIMLPGGRLTDTDVPDEALYQHFAMRFSRAVKSLADVQAMVRPTK